MKTPNLLLTNFREQSHEAGVLDGLGEFALILRASPSLAAGRDLAIRVNEPGEQFDILVVDEFDMVLGEEADLLPRSHFLESHVFLFPFGFL
jgi:hypothetical protein